MLSHEQKTHTLKKLVIKIKKKKKTLFVIFFYLWGKYNLYVRQCMCKLFLCMSEKVMYVQACFYTCLSSFLNKWPKWHLIEADVWTILLVITLLMQILDYAKICRCYFEAFADCATHSFIHFLTNLIFLEVRVTRHCTIVPPQV